MQKANERFKEGLLVANHSQMDLRSLLTLYLVFHFVFLFTSIYSHPIIEATFYIYNKTR